MGGLNNRNQLSLFWRLQVQGLVPPEASLPGWQPASPISSCGIFSVCTNVPHVSSSSFKDVSHVGGMTHPNELILTGLTSLKTLCPNTVTFWDILGVRVSTSDLGECNSVYNTHRYMYRIYIYPTVMCSLYFLPEMSPAHISRWEGWPLVTFALNSRWEEEKASRKQSY